jgi:hypothetical protein
LSGKENMPRRRYGWWLLWVGLLGTSAVGSLIFIAFSRPPEKAVDLFGRLQIGMGSEEVFRVLQTDPEVFMNGGALNGSCSQYFFSLEEDWEITVFFSQDQLIDKWLIRIRNPSWYRRAWRSLRRVIPSLPNLLGRVPALISGGAAE